MSESDLLLVLITCPATAAETLAEALVERRLAACVNAVPGLRSTYRWQGAVEHAQETLLLAKTTAEALPALADAVHRLHPYELPEIVAVPIRTGLPAYLAWVAENVGEAGIR